MINDCTTPKIIAHYACSVDYAHNRYTCTAFITQPLVYVMHCPQPSKQNMFTVPFSQQPRS